MQRIQMNVVSFVLILLTALLGTASCGSTIIKVPPLKPGQVNRTIKINIPPTVDVQRTLQLGNNTSAQIVLGSELSPGSDCLLSNCDENDVACDGLQPCGPVCPGDACSRVSCSQCWQSGFSGPCCLSCCSQYIPYQQPAPYSQQTYGLSVQTQQPITIPYPQVQTIPLVQPQPIPVSQPQPVQFSLPQPVTYPQLQPIPVSQPQPILVPQPQLNPIPFPVPVPQPQPIPFPQPRPVPYPVPVPQPYVVPQPQPVPVPYPQLQQVGVQRVATSLQAMTVPQTQCRPIQSWPFLQCPSQPQVQPQQPPCYWQQPGCLQQIQQYPNMCYPSGPC